MNATKSNIKYSNERLNENEEAVERNTFFPSRRRLKNYTATWGHRSRRRRRRHHLFSLHLTDHKCRGIKLDGIQSLVIYFIFKNHNIVLPALGKIHLANKWIVLNYNNYEYVNRMTGEQRLTRKQIDG